ncbi:MAG: nitric-oxide reductase large subunit [Halodesulfurarchaeum sp.]
MMDSKTIDRGTIAKILAGIFVLNLVVMGLGAWYTYESAPAIPEDVVGPEGQTIATGEQIQAGKVTLQSNGLMDFGSVLGEGSYYGEDFTADALALKRDFMGQYYAQQRYDTAYSNLAPAQVTVIDATVKADLQSSPGSDESVIRYSAAEVYAHEQVREAYVEKFYEGDLDRGIAAGTVESAADARRLADFALWTAWIAHTERPGSDMSYTNDWPPVPGTGNQLPDAAMIWSVFALLFLVVGVGAAVALFFSVELPEPEHEGVDIPSPEDISLLPSQIASARFMLLAAVLFVLQTLLGGFMAHYYIERGGFYGLGELLGVNLIALLPFQVLKAWHVELAIVWVAVLWMGGGLFLASLLSGYEPRWQKSLTNLLLGAVTVVGVGALLGIWAGTLDLFGGDLWWILGNEGLEYLEMGRLWQVGVLVGFLLWVGLMYRAIRPVLEGEQRYGIGHMLLYASVSIPGLFLAGFLFTPASNWVVTQFWRWWVVHMWVEGVFEFFIVAAIAGILLSIGLLRRRVAEKAILLEAALVMGTGIVGIAHHYWWIGMPEAWMPISSVWSTLELVPLLIILYDAIAQYRTLGELKSDFAYSVPLLFVIASGVWNFLGAGILGTMINFPVVGYFEHGTYLTVAHAHAAFFGSFGMLALGLGTFVLRYTTSQTAFPETRFRQGFWAMNIGLSLMLLLSVIPIGFLQLETVYTAGYDVARSIAFYNRPLVQQLMWARMPGDILLIAGAILYLVAMGRAVLASRSPASDTDAVSGRIVPSDD